MDILPTVVSVAADEPEAAQRVVAWIRANRVLALNVAGPRESKGRGTYAAARALLEVVLRELSAGAATTHPAP